MKNAARGWLLTPVASFALLASETPVDVSELVANITSGLVTDRNDARIARALTSFSLTQRLTADTCERLVKLGVGPETARALQVLSRRSASLPLPAHEVLSTAPIPSEDESAAMITKMRRYSAEYLTRLPDFIATREVRQFHNYKTTRYGHEVDGNWYAAAAFTTDAAYVAGHNYLRTPEEFHGRGVSLGEFGGMMEEIFSATRDARFTWDRWQVMHGVRTAAFAYPSKLQILAVFDLLRARATRPFRRVPAVHPRRPSWPDLCHAGIRENCPSRPVRPN